MPPSETVRTTCVVAGVTLAAAILYYYLLAWQAADLRLYLFPWLDALLERGRFDGISAEFSNYSPPYLYVLSFASLAIGPLGRLGVVKAAALIGVVACACSVYHLARVYTPRHRAVIIALCYLIVPTVALNGAAWGQADALYTAPVLFAIAESIRERWPRALAAMGVALAIKLQAIFIAPFLLYQFLARRFSPWLAGWTIAAFAMMLLPAWVAGRPAAALATIYAGQGAYYHKLSMNVPNVWHVIQRSKLVDYETGVFIGIGLGAIAGLAIAAAAFRRRRLDALELLVLAVLTVVVIPYVLPKMHDRYFYVAEVLAFVLMSVHPRVWTVAVFVLLQLGALNAYAFYLFRVGSTGAGALLNGSALLLLVYRGVLLFRRSGVTKIPGDADLAYE